MDKRVIVNYQMLKEMGKCKVAQCDSCRFLKMCSKNEPLCSKRCKNWWETLMTNEEYETFRDTNRKIQII